MRNVRARESDRDCVRVYVCVHMWEREGEREKERESEKDPDRVLTVLTEGA